MTWTSPNGGGGDGGGGDGGGGDGTATCDDCVNDFTAYGSECCDTAWVEYGISCSQLESNYGWDCAGCTCPGDVADSESEEIDVEGFSELSVYDGQFSIESSIELTLEDFMNKVAFANNVNSDDNSMIINSSRDLEGYNIYRDGNFLDFVTTTSYNDSNIAVGLEYCYTVTAVYDTGSSIDSNEDCAAALAQPSSVNLSLDEAIFISFVYRYF